MSTRTTLNDDGDLQNYINGEWRAPTGGDGQDIVNPATGEKLTHVPFSSTGDVDEAVNSASEAFQSWKSKPIEERIQPFFQYKQLLEAHIDDLAELLVIDHGKTLDEAKGEIRRGIENVEVACGIPSMMQGGTLANAAPDIDESAIRQPLGVFAGITPFNFPGMIPLWFLPYAVATGNTFLLKPSERVPLVPQRLIQLLTETDLPEDVIQLLNGSADTVNAILEHDGVSGVSFVGSTPVARHVYETAAATGKRVQAQGGAKNHIIVTESADLSFAAKQAVSSSFACAGERCLANDVVVVENSVYNEFVNHVVKEAKSQRVGYGLDKETDIGALISSEHKKSVCEHIQAGINEGAEILLDGRNKNIEGYEDGNFLGPTVFRDISPDHTIAREEIFGPVLGLQSVPDLETAIQIVNESQYGNAASLFTGRGADAQTYRHTVEAGNLGVNVGTAAPMAFFHFGGQKASFFGDLHAQGEDMVYFFTDKTIYIERWPSQSN